MEGGSRYPSRATPTAIRLPLKIRMARRTPTLRRRLRSPPPRIPPLLRHQRARHRPHARRQLQYRHRHPLAPHQLHPPRPLLPLLPQSPRKRPKHGSRHPHENPGERTTRTAPKHAGPVLLPSIGASRVIALNSIATTTASPASDSAYRLRRFRSHGRRPTATTLPSLTVKPAPDRHHRIETRVAPTPRQTAHMGTFDRAGAATVSQRPRSSTTRHPRPHPDQSRTGAICGERGTFTHDPSHGHTGVTGDTPLRSLHVPFHPTACWDLRR